MLQEQQANAPDLVSYQTAVRQKSFINKIITSPIKGFLPVVKDMDVDVVESIISPAITSHPWICSLANFQEAMAFSLLGLPIPKAARRVMLEHIFAKDNFIGFAFWSEAGKKTLHDYGDVKNSTITKKAHVIYPAVGYRIDRAVQNKIPETILFSGDFFRKGGVHLVDAFERIQEKNKHLVLRLCCDFSIDFHTNDNALRQQYIEKIKSNPRILVGRVGRDVLVNKILPETAVYVIPTYDETFGFAILEALAAGVPVIATSEFAIPEMVTNQESGWLIPYSKAEKSEMMKGYVVNSIPRVFHQRLSEAVFDILNNLYDGRYDYQGMVAFSQSAARGKFSFSERNRKLSKLYERR